MKNLRLCLLFIIITGSASGQIAAVKLLGKNSDKYKLGFGAFTYYDFSLTEVGNQSLRLELVDYVFFKPKIPNTDKSILCLSIKLGYRNIFSETKTGFYVEPQLGYAIVANPDGSGQGLAGAAELGYSQEVGKGDNTLNLGLKYERDRIGSEYSISTLGLRFSFSVHLFQRKSD